MKKLLVLCGLTGLLISHAHAEQPTMTIYGTFDNQAPKGLPPQLEIKPTVSSISIYGTIDAGIRNVTNTTANGGSHLTMGSNGQYYNNRFGIKGEEDLGGGMNAHFHLESGFNSGTGALDNNRNAFFNRISSVGIAGAFGSVDFGRQPSVSCKTIHAYDPFSYRYVQIIPLAGAAAGNADGNFPGYSFGTMGGTRYSNAVQYIGKFDAWTTMAEYSFGEVSGSDSAGSAKAVSLIYRTGPYTVGGALTRQKPNVGTGSTVDYRNQDQITFGGAWKVGPFRAAGGYIRTTADTATPGLTHQAKNSWIGSSYDFTPVVSATAGYYKTTLETAGNEAARRNLIIVGATYALSSRTNLYADIDRATLTGIAAVVPDRQTRQTGISMGINHMF